MRRLAPLLLGLTLLSPAHPDARTVDDGQHRVHVGGQEVEVRRVHLPVIIEPRGRKAQRTARCAPLSPDDLIVTEDHSPLLVTAVERSTLDALHVVLLDTSSSMRERLTRTKETATRYLHSLPPHERALVASFDDSLLLHSPPRLDRQVLEQAVHGLDLGQNTALWSSLYYMLRYLDALPAHKVVILLSDGEDSSSLPQHTAEVVLEMASTVPNLTMFAIGLDLTSAPGGDSPLAGLQTLARRTGGAFFEIEDVDDLDRVLQAIRRRLEHKYYVSYIPKPFGRGPKDEPDRFDSRLRVIDVRAKDEVPCRVTALARQTRLEGRRPARVSEPAPSAAAPRASLAAGAACVGLPESWTVERAIRFRSPHLPGDEDGRDMSSLLRVRGADLWLGWLLDITLDAGVLYDRQPLAHEQTLRLDLRARAELQQRTVALAVPPADVVRQTIHQPEDVLAFLLAAEDCVGRLTDGMTDPRWINGLTWLDAREFFALALRATSHEYRTWSEERIRELGWSQFRGLLAEYERRGGATDEQLQSLRSMVQARARNPEPELPQLFLAEWLGDVPAHEAAMRWQRRAVGRLLAGARHGTATPTSILAHQWQRLREWLPAPTDVRVVTPLVPAYDAEREVFGFYRFILPRPAERGSRERLVPEAPLGVRLVDWLLARTGAAAALPADVHVLELQQSRELREDSGAGSAVASTVVTVDVVRLTLAGGNETLELYAEFGGGSAEPSCVDARGALRIELPRPAPRSCAPQYNVAGQDAAGEAPAR